MNRTNISRMLLRPEGLLTLTAAILQVKHWSLESHGLRLRGNNSNFVTTIVFENWYSPFAVVALLFAAGYWLARRFPQWGIAPYVCGVSLFLTPLLVYRLIVVYNIVYFTGTPSFYLAGLPFYTSFLNTLLMLALIAFVVGQLIYIAKWAAGYLEEFKANA
ncbi:hypothetical protein [Chitinophaga deserti]|uniref:hypothetical protein n=1 Tax=Chitinophaga deserti TaxID=2164099 RepID=UPI000D6BBB1D|nr:hypothetical protein [Chitinophaga deserti]